MITRQFEPTTIPRAKTLNPLTRRRDHSLTLSRRQPKKLLTITSMRCQWRGTAYSSRSSNESRPNKQIHFSTKTRNWLPSSDRRIHSLIQWAVIKDKAVSNKKVLSNTVLVATKMVSINPITITRKRPGMSLSQTISRVLHISKATIIWLVTMVCSSQYPILICTRNIVITRILKTIMDIVIRLTSTQIIITSTIKMVLTAIITSSH